MKHAIRFQGVMGLGWTSKAIAWWGGGNQFSHFMCVLPDGNYVDARSDVVTVESADGEPVHISAGVQSRPKDYEPWSRKVLFEKEVTKKVEAKWLDAVHSQIGKPYDHIGILDFIFGSDDDRNWRDQSAWFCDEFCLWTAEQAGFTPLYIPAYRIAPNSASVALSAWGFKWNDLPPTT
jgi:hypothetical protein